MSDKKIFIALSQREARSVLTAINFLTNACLKDAGDTFEVKQENAAAVGITAEELSELFNFGYHLGALADEQAEPETSIQHQKSGIQVPGITATAHYTLAGLPRQRSFTAVTEEQLLADVFMFPIDNHELKIEIKSVDYRGQQLPWNDFMAHNHFAKGRITLEEFKSACLTPEKPAL
jgi:hypothetical protein